MLPSKPARNCVWGPIVIGAFLLTQCADGVLTYFGLTHFGHEAEGNPFVAYLIAKCGLSLGIIIAKSLGSFLGTILYLAPSRVFPNIAILVMLILLHLFTAITGWTWVLLFF